ncbi:MAG: ATP-binding protein [Arcobacteraceae bacterium]|jgi:AAA+ ATPase superfamily predicted ATPase|nr:ATP-binding protein [Arcobacteraceae bacterium]
MNPFVYQKSCSGDSFCYRKDELIQINKMITQRENIFIYSKRKFGKTSLIKEFFHKNVDKNRYFTFYFDLFGITNFVDFVKNIYKHIALNLPEDYHLRLKHLKDLFARASFTAIIKDNGELEFNPVLNSYNLDELLADIYKGLEKLSLQSGKKIIIAFDEFQQISNLKESKGDVLLRKYIDKYSDVRYIFTGLKRHLLSDIFSKKYSSFYNIAQKLELKQISKEKLYEYVDKRFKNKLSYELFERIYDNTEGELKLIQEICYHLYYVSCIKKNEILTSEVVDYVCNSLLESKNEYFKLLLNQLTMPQKIALKAVVLSNGTELYKKENLFNLQVTKSSLNTAIRHLYKDEIIDKENNKYYISNKCLELWCKKAFL